jgi:hypothetical protein
MKETRTQAIEYQNPGYTAIYAAHDICIKTVEIYQRYSISRKYDDENDMLTLARNMR